MDVLYKYDPQRKYIYLIAVFNFSKLMDIYLSTELIMSSILIISRPTPILVRIQLKFSKLNESIVEPYADMLFKLA